jgi:hypothetical protein
LRSLGSSDTLGGVKRVPALALSVSLIVLAAVDVAQSQLTSIPTAPPVTSIPGRPADAIDQARRRALAPIPKAPGLPATADRWVPERRFYSSEYQREIVIPGHYESRITDQQYAVPPITGYGPSGQNPVFFPGGERPPADQRQGP